MRNALKLLPVAAIAALPFGPLHAEDAASPETVVATVNGQDITLGNMMILYANLPQQYQQIPVEQLFDGILNQLIQQETLKQAFTGTPPASVTLSLENEKRALLAASEIGTMLEGVSTDEAVQAAYDAKYADGSEEPEWNASHILVETEDEAKAIKKVLEDGGDFAEVAKTSSTGPSGPSGGSLGWFKAGQMVPAFEEAVKTMKPGDISDPVQTRFGWHIIKLNETRIAEAPALDDVRGEIVNELESAAIEDYVNKLTDEADIERPDLSNVDPSILQQTDLLD
ncbi:MAG: peptidylprolyl isomerase [Rhodobacteraceae bacterium]|nr:peptidylprolyl isomerase [Paracoccaceae bacterium]MAY45842.1 peptidylprolyl isomerase [Paracoccaceae bacterium]QEW22819.1 Foldase protein PrsA precursor [Marinibacterium anthonyi]